MTSSYLERVVDTLTRTPARLIEAIAFCIVIGAFTLHIESRSIANTLVNGLVTAGLAVAVLRISGISGTIADRVGLGPKDRIEGQIRMVDFAPFHEVEIEGDAVVWRRLGDVRIRTPATGHVDLYDILINPTAVGYADGQQVFRVMLYRHNDDKTWPTDISFDKGRVAFNFVKIDQDIPPLIVGLRTGPVHQFSVRSSMETPSRPARTAPIVAGSPYDQIAHAIIGRGPRNAREVGLLRRKVGKALHPDTAPADEREARVEALKRANGYLDQFKP
jgi:hypothetical protein